jgi:hypothetical protein
MESEVGRKKGSGVLRLDPLIPREGKNGQKPLLSMSSVLGTQLERLLTFFLLS